MVKVPQKDWSKNHLSTWMLILAPSGWPKTAKLHLEILVATIYMQIFSILLFLRRLEVSKLFIYLLALLLSQLKTQYRTATN